MIDVSDLPEGTPIWVTGFLGALLIVLTLSEKLMKFKGPLGTLARLWHNRQIREVERRATLNARIEKLVADRVHSETQGMRTETLGMRKSIEDLTRKVADLEAARDSDKKRIAELEDSRTLWAAFATELTEILLRVRQRLAEHGLDMPEKIPTFAQFHARSRDPT